MWRRLAVGTVLVLVLVLAGCGDDEGEAGSAESDSPHPPNTVEELAEVFDPQLEPLGLRLTRGALIDRSDGGYIPSDEGEHLALYVEPIDDTGYTTADYVEGIGTVTALVTPQVFERWSAVESYDICQEPPADVDDRDAPAPYTQIEMDRAQAESVDWETATTETVMGLSQTGQVRLIVTPVISADPGYQEAFAAAA
jgi:hypothetical protein